jgi:hypothetical protein
MFKLRTICYLTRQTIILFLLSLTLVSCANAHPAPVPTQLIASIITPMPINTLQPTPTPKPLSTQLENEIATWKMYFDSNLQVSFRYPANYEVIEILNGILIGKDISVNLVVGKTRYFGCAIPIDKCPQGISMEINGKQVFKKKGNETSIGGKNLLEYEFMGINPKTPVVSSDTEYHLFFDYTGDISNVTSINIFNEIIKTVEYKYGREPGPRG